MSRRTSSRFVAGSFVDAMRCIPFLLFAYIVYYGLPSVGVDRFDGLGCPGPA